MRVRSVGTTTPGAEVATLRRRGRDQRPEAPDRRDVAATALRIPTHGPSRGADCPSPESCRLAPDRTPPSPANPPSAATAASVLAPVTPLHHGTRLDHHESLRPGVVVGQRDMDHRLVPAGVIARSRSAAQPVTCITGWPERRFVTAMSFQDIPIRRPVPKAFEHASFAAQRLA
jgi:hypothetical protein